MTPAECQAKAEECDRLALACSYMKDRDRLLKDAASWRNQARVLETQALARQREMMAPKPFWRRPR